MSISSENMKMQKTQFRKKCQLGPFDPTAFIYLLLAYNREIFYINIKIVLDLIRVNICSVISLIREPYRKMIETGE